MGKAVQSGVYSRRGILLVSRGGLSDETYILQGSIAGAVVVIFVVIALCALATFFLVRMRNRRRTQVSPSISFVPTLPQVLGLDCSCPTDWVCLGRQAHSGEGCLYGDGCLDAFASTNTSAASICCLKREVIAGRVLQTWPCSPTLISRAMASSRGMAVTQDMVGSSRAMGSSRATGSRVMVSRGMEGSLIVVHMEAISLPAILHKVRAMTTILLTNGLLPVFSSCSLALLQPIPGAEGPKLPPRM